VASKGSREFEELLLWITFILKITLNLDGDGVVCALGREMKLTLGVEDWSEVEKCLTRCLWTEKVQNRYCLAFWDEETLETLELDVTNQAGEFSANHGQQQPLFGDLNPAIAEARPPAPQLCPAIDPTNPSIRRPYPVRLSDTTTQRSAFYAF
jgi:hypothetical protein